MTRPYASRVRALKTAALAVPLLVALPSWADSPVSLFYERTLMDRAGARCHLFLPDIATTLAAAALQARGAALRSGSSPENLRQVAARAELKAYAVPCNSPDLAIAADRVRKAFDGYAQLRQENFPGALSSWSADRKPWPLVVRGKVAPGPRWRLWQTSGAMTFGVADGAGLTAVIASPDAASASAARLILRDPSKAADAVLDPRRSGLAGRAPPRSVTQAFLAGSVGPAPASLSPPGAHGGIVTFSPEAAKALAALDPREAATVELIFPTHTGERVETNMIEVGDFAAGRAFLAAGR